VFSNAQTYGNEGRMLGTRREMTSPVNT
jgi:hypothetical protein